MNGKTFNRIAVLLVAATLLAACAPAALTPAGTTPPAPTATEPAATPAVEPTRPAPDKPVIGESPTPAEDGAAMEAPAEVIDLVKADLAERLGSQPADLKVVRSEAVVWNDGSLGCPQPGVFYTQSLVSGYQVILQSGETTYDYRVAGLESQPVLCEQPLPTRP